MKLPFWTVVLLAVSIRVANGKICTKEIRFTSSKLKFNKFTNRVYAVEEVKKKIDYVCCEGYTQVGTTGLQPICDPICEHSCGHGLCYTPNTCACDLGYKHSEIGTCVLDESVKTTPSSNTPSSTTPLSTTPSSTTPSSTTSSSTTPSSTTPSSTPPSSTTLLSTTPSSTTPSSTTSSSTTPSSTTPSSTTPSSTTSKTTQEVTTPRHSSRSTQKKELLSTTSLVHVEVKVPVTPKYFNLNRIYTTLQDTPLTTTSTELVGVIPDVFQVHASPISHEKLTQTTQNIPNTTTISPRYINTVKAPENTCGTCTFGTCQSGTCVCPSGYILSHEGNCEPLCIQSCQFGRCSAHNFCQCQDGYIYDSDRHQCRPLCNGKIYGCIRGHCVGYNQCRCDNGTVLLKNELFHCVDNDSLHEQTFDKMWFFLFLLIPIVLVFVSCFVIIKRWNNAKVNRKDNQDPLFPEVRYYNSENDHSNEQTYQKARSIDNEAFGEASCSRGTIQRNGNLVIINT